MVPSIANFKSINVEIDHPSIIYPDCINSDILTTLDNQDNLNVQGIIINYNDTHDSQTAQKVVNPFQRRNSVGVLEYEPVTVEQRPKSIRNIELKQTFPPTKTNIFKPIDNTRTKILTKSLETYPPELELPPPPPFNLDTEDERLPE